MPLTTTSTPHTASDKLCAPAQAGSEQLDLNLGAALQGLQDLVDDMERELLSANTPTSAAPSGTGD